MRAHFCHVRIWHQTGMPKYLGNVRCWVNSGKHMLALSFSGFDPIRTYFSVRFCAAVRRIADVSDQIAR